MVSLQWWGWELRERTILGRQRHERIVKSAILNLALNLDFLFFFLSWKHLEYPLCHILHGTSHVEMIQRDLGSADLRQTHFEVNHVENLSPQMSTLLQRLLKKARRVVDLE